MIQNMERPSETEREADRSRPRNSKTERKDRERETAIDEKTERQSGHTQRQNAQAKTHANYSVQICHGSTSR